MPSTPAKRQRQDMNHRDAARNVAMVLREYTDHLDRAYTAEQYGAEAHARNHRTDANRVLLDASQDVRAALNLARFTVNPSTGEAV